MLCKWPLQVITRRYQLPCEHGVILYNIFHFGGVAGECLHPSQQESPVRPKLGNPNPPPPMASPDTKTVLITGCSDGGIGSALAVEFHRRGHRVIGTARDPSKMAALAAANIETRTLDVTSSSSIASCAGEVSALTGGALDMLVNNAGAGYTMPVADVDVDRARALFDVNFWAVVTVTQAFLPLLMKSKKGGLVVNNGSCSSVIPHPHMAMYCASKAAAAMLTDVMRLELAPWGISVVDLKTGSVESRFFDNNNNNNNNNNNKDLALPRGSIYAPIETEIAQLTAGQATKSKGTPAARVCQAGRRRAGEAERAAGAALARRICSPGVVVPDVGAAHGPRRLHGQGWGPGCPAREVEDWKLATP